MGLRIHKPLSLRLLEPPVGPSGSPSVLPVCPLAALSRTEGDSAQKLCNKRREVRAFHVKSLPNEKWHVCKLSVHFGPVTQSPRGGRKVAGLIPAWLFLLVDGCPSLCVADGGSGWASAPLGSSVLHQRRTESPACLLLVLCSFISGSPLGKGNFYVIPNFLNVAWPVFVCTIVFFYFFYDTLL